MGTTIWTEENIGGILDAAMADGKVVAYYQPKYDAITGKVAGAGAFPLDRRRRTTDSAGTVCTALRKEYADYKAGLAYFRRCMPISAAAIGRRHPDGADFSEFFTGAHA